MVEIYSSGNIIKGHIMRKILLIILFFCGLGVVSVAFAETTTERSVKELTNYKQTGEFERCISNNLIKTTMVLDDGRILFKMKHNKYMLNTMKSECPRLAFNKNFAYGVGGDSQLCGSDIISVVNYASGGGASCVLGEFEVLERKPRS